MPLSLHGIPQSVRTVLELTSHGLECGHMSHIVARETRVCGASFISGRSRAQLKSRVQY